MSRRRGEFEHRTSIFEGAFRAWSHLGGLEPEDLESQAVSDLDPLNNPIDDDSRLSGVRRAHSAANPTQNPDGTHRRQYPYEPLPRSGLAHPYVQAILSPWLGPDADNDAIQLGLTTLRTWWQHRRKGESGSAIAALGTDKMRGVVEGYTRHFFTLAHCLIMNDKEQPPRSLHTKMKELDKVRSKKSKKRARDEEAGKIHQLALNGGLSTGASDNGVSGSNGMNMNANNPAALHQMQTGDTDQPSNPVAVGLNADLTDSNLSPLERLHAAQRRQLAENGGIHTTVTNANDPNGLGVTLTCTTNTNINPDPNAPLIHIKQKCVPGKVDLPAVLEAVNHHATQLAHRGSSGAVPNSAPSSSPGNSSGQYGDPQTFPVIFVSNGGDVLLSMLVDGITCAHCVKIVETVLKGCNGNKSPIDGLLDAAADRTLCGVLIKIDRASNAKRIAFEAARNLAMVGYTAKSKEINILTGDGKKDTYDIDALNKAVEVVGRADPKGLFDWTIPCTCPDNGVLRDDCSRHSQMNDNVFTSFENRGELVLQYMRNGKISTGEADSLTEPLNISAHDGQMHMNNQHQQQSHNRHLSHRQSQQPIMTDQYNQPIMSHDNMNMGQDGMDFFGNSGGGGGMGQHNASVPSTIGGNLSSNQLMDHNNNHHHSNNNNHHNNHHHQSNNHYGGSMQMPMRGSMAQRASIISFGGNGLRSMSFASEAASFGRAMSGLSALSIDWENMDDFDINVDHSSHITNEGVATGGRFNPGSENDMGMPQTVGVNMANVLASSSGGGGTNSGAGGRRSSIRRSFIANGQDAHVSFKV